MDIKRRTNGAAISAIREALGMTQTRLASLCGVSGAYLSNIEAGRKYASAQVTVLIAQNLGVPVDAITYPALEKLAA